MYSGNDLKNGNNISNDYEYDGRDGRKEWNN